MIVGGEHSAGLQIACQVFAHGPGDRETIEGGGATADLIEQHQGAVCGVVKDVGGLRHLHHERGLAGCQIIHGADPGEDAIRQPDARGLRRHPAAHLGQQLDQPDLTQVAALAAGIGAGEHHQILAIPEGHVVGGESTLHQQLLHHGMA